MRRPSTSSSPLNDNYIITTIMNKLANLTLLLRDDQKVVLYCAKIVSTIEQAG